MLLFCVRFPRNSWNSKQENNCRCPTSAKEHSNETVDESSPNMEPAVNLSGEQKRASLRHEKEMFRPGDALCRRQLNAQIQKGCSTESISKQFKPDQRNANIEKAPQLSQTRTKKQNALVFDQARRLLYPFSRKCQSSLGLHVLSSIEGPEFAIRTGVQIA